MDCKKATLFKQSMFFLIRTKQTCLDKPCVYGKDMANTGMSWQVAADQMRKHIFVAHELAKISLSR